MTLQNDIDSITTILNDLESSDIDLDRASEQYAEAIQRCKAVMEKLTQIDNTIDSLTKDAYALSPAT